MTFGFLVFFGVFWVIAVFGCFSGYFGVFWGVMLCYCGFPGFSGFLCWASSVLIILCILGVECVCWVAIFGCVIEVLVKFAVLGCFGCFVRFVILSLWVWCDLLRGWVFGLPAGFLVLVWMILVLSFFRCFDFGHIAWSLFICVFFWGGFWLLIYGGLDSSFFIGLFVVDLASSVFTLCFFGLVLISFWLDWIVCWFMFSGDFGLGLGSLVGLVWCLGLLGVSFYWLWVSVFGVWVSLCASWMRVWCNWCFVGCSS